MKPQLTIEAFADWCARQPADAEYDYGSNSNCAFCQYLKFIGISVDGVGGTYWRSADAPEVKRTLPDGIQDALSDGAHTFGALAQRLRA